jgi:hypothetical protein
MLPLADVVEELRDATIVVAGGVDVLDILRLDALSGKKHLLRHLQQAVVLAGLIGVDRAIGKEDVGAA